MANELNQVKNTKDLRMFNKRSIVELLRSREGATKSEMAKSLGLSFATASNLCNELVEEQIFVPALSSAVSGGRPSEVLTLNAQAKLSLCIDFTYKSVVKLQLLDLKHTQVAEASVPLGEAPSIQQAAAQCAAAYNQLLADVRLPHERVLGAAVILPGLVDLRTGSVLNSTLPVLNHTQLEAVLSEALQLPIIIENDANLAAVAVAGDGSGAAQEHVLFLYIGEGLGLGIASSSSAIYRGYRGFAGEIAHIPIGTPEYACYCGHHGCIEGVLSTEGLDELQKSNPHPAAFAGFHLGKLISILANLLDPQLIYVGGDREALLQDMLPYAQQEAGRRTLLQPFRDIPIRACTDVHSLFNRGASELLIRRWMTG
jgi:predicted NBD/HSP70 family sugar kinase/DNA-binding XRE family transcriptional regulator